MARRKNDHVNIPMVQRRPKTDDCQGCNLREAAFRKNYKLTNDDITNDRNSIKYKGNDGSTLLHSMVNKFKERNTATITNFSLLLERGADAIAQDNDGDTPLHIAARKGIESLCSVLIKFLRENGGILHINAKNKEGMMPIHCAAKGGYYKIIDMLLRHDADACHKDCKKYLPIHYAAMGGYEECCKLLAPHYPNNSQIKITPIHLAARGGHAGCLDALKSIKDKIDINAVDHGNNAAIHLAVKEGSEKGVKILLDDLEASHEVLSKSGNTPLMIAVKRNNLGCFKILKEAGASLTEINKAKQNVLHIAAFGNCVECMEYSLQSSEVKNKINEKDKEGLTPLAVAIKRQHHRCAHILLLNNASVTETLGKKASSLLHFAAQNSSSETLRRLPFDKLDVNQRNRDGRTPLHEAAEKGSSEACLWLLSKGASVNTFDNQHKTALYLSARQGHLAVLRELLLTDDINVRLVDNSESTALHVAAERGYLECCKALLQKDSGLENEQNNKHKFAVNNAIIRKQSEVVKFLINYKQFKDFKSLEPKEKKKRPKERKKGPTEKEKEPTEKEKGPTEKEKGPTEKEKGPTEKEKEPTEKEKEPTEKEKGPTEKEKGPTEREKWLAEKEKQRVYIEELHKSTHQALHEKHEGILEVIAESDWWESGFAPERHGKEPCSSFRDLINHHPGLATTVMNKCLPTKKDQQYDFRIFEDNYYMEDGSSPFVEGSGKNAVILHDNAKELQSDRIMWKKLHPVSIMIRYKRWSLLQHPLVEAWLTHKWWCYARRVIYAAVILQLISVIILGCFNYYVKNWNQIQNVYNMTEQQFCDESVRSTALEMKAGVSEWNPAASLALHILLSLSLVIQITLEVLQYRRLRKNLVDRYLPLKVACFIATFITLLPVSKCEVTLGIKSVPMWECGVVALVLSCFVFIHVLSYTPKFKLLSSITGDFLLLYANGVILLTMILFMFAVVFKVILVPATGFTSIWQSVVIMFIWLAGDYNYDSSFMENPLQYPILSNILFVVFIIIVGGLLILVLKSPSRSESEISFLRKARWANLLLNIDICYPLSWRRKYVFAKVHADNQVFRVSAKIFRLIARCIPFLKDYMLYRGEDKENYFVSLDESEQDENPHVRKLDEVFAKCDRIADVVQKLHKEILEMKKLHAEMVEMKK